MGLNSLKLQRLTSAVQAINLKIATEKAEAIAQAAQLAVAAETAAKIAAEQRSDQLAAQQEQTNQLVAQVASTVNQHAYSFVHVPGHSGMSANEQADTLTLVPGNNILLSTDPTTNTITIDSNDTSVNWTEVQSKPSIPSITVSGNSIYITV
jgi:hypothetical protein